MNQTEEFEDLVRKARVILKEPEDNIFRKALAGTIKSFFCGLANEKDTAVIDSLPEVEEKAKTEREKRWENECAFREFLEAVRKDFGLGRYAPDTVAAREAWVARRRAGRGK